MKHVKIRLGIAPIEGKNFMYRLVPREELTPGVYEFKLTGEFGTRVFFSCLAVNTTFDQWFDSVKAETTGQNFSGAWKGSSAGRCFRELGGRPHHRRGRSLV